MVVLVTLCTARNILFSKTPSVFCLRYPVEDPKTHCFFRCGAFLLDIWITNTWYRLCAFGVPWLSCYWPLGRFNLCCPLLLLLVVLFLLFCCISCCCYWCFLFLFCCFCCCGYWWCCCFCYFDVFGVVIGVVVLVTAVIVVVCMEFLIGASLSFVYFCYFRYLLKVEFVFLILHNIIKDNRIWGWCRIIP